MMSASCLERTTYSNAGSTHLAAAKSERNRDVGRKENGLKRLGLVGWPRQVL